jgi:hypothetical protein
VLRVFRFCRFCALLVLGVFSLCKCVGVQAQQNPPAPTKPIAAPSLTGAPWTGDFDAMLKRRYIRVLVAYSKTQYYVVNGVQHGSSYECLKAFEDWVNLKYPQKVKNTKFHVVILPDSARF